jgi:hypothetical protein
MPYQVELDNDAAADTRLATVTLVQPEMKDIHNGFTIDPGLIRIRMAHGYMRTDDVMFAQLVYGDTTPVSVNAISGALHTTDIVSLRYQIWCREQDVVGWQVIQDPDLTVNPPTAPAIPSVDQQALADVRQMKKQLQQKVAARVNGTKYDGSPITLNGKQLNTLFGAASPGGLIPEQPIPANTWWLQYEAHQPGIYPGSVFPPIPPRQDDFSAVAPPLWDSNTPFTPLPLTSASKQVACLDSAQHVHQLFVTIGTPWAQKDLTVLTGAPPAVARSPLSGYQWPGGNSEQVVYLDGSGHVHELWVTPSTPWKHADLTQLTGAPPVVAGSPLSGYAWDYQWAGGTSKQVDYLDTAGHVHEMWVVAGGGPWKDADLTAYAGAPPAVARSPLSGYQWAARLSA